MKPEISMHISIALAHFHCFSLCGSRKFLEKRLSVRYPQRARVAAVGSMSAGQATAHRLQADRVDRIVQGPAAAQRARDLPDHLRKLVEPL